MATADRRRPTTRTRPPAKANPMRRSTDIEDVRFPTRAVVGLVLFTAALVGGQWAITSGLRSDVAASRAESMTAIQSIVQRMDAQEKIDNAAVEAARKVQEAEKRVLDDKLQGLDERIKQLDRDYKLGDYDLKAMIGVRK